MDLKALRIVEEVFIKFIVDQKKIPPSMKETF
jgi:hypothetical protein